MRRIVEFMRLLAFTISIYILGGVSGLAIGWWWVERSLTEWERSNRSRLDLERIPTFTPEKKSPEKKSNDRIKRQNVPA